MKSPSILGLALLPLLVGCEGRPTPREANPPSPIVAATALRPAPDFEAEVAPVLDRYCLDCHGSASKRGGVALEGPSIREDLATWGRVADALRSRSMPPIGRPMPGPEEVDTIARWIDGEVFGCSVPDPGRVTMRRLNRAEYDHTIRDLLGLDLHLADAFPADDVGYGFDNIGDVLSIPPILMEKYLAAAGLAIDAASSSPQSWAKIMNPPPDAIPLGLRKPRFETRSEPVKRIGQPAVAAPVIEDPEVVALRRAHEVIRAFADRAFRRPATQEELTRLIGLVESARKDGDSHEVAIRYALKGVLISPHFLFLVEEEPMTGRGLIDEFALAARLSYFLWSSLPDDELYRLATRSELRVGDNLAKQARRMLVDDKAKALVDGFAAQWLQTRALKDITPDPALFPFFDDRLREAMVCETSMFAASIIREDRSVLEFLDADHTFLNERLARHYGIVGIVGEHFRRVSLAGTGRGGVLTHASILTVTSNPTRTSPVKRGKWVLDNILGQSPPPPPEGVEALRENGKARHSGTLRQQMEQHRLDPACASCHARMDPLGFSLENFDAIGAWRTLDGNQPVDASGTLPGGESFSGPSGLREVLMSRRETFVRCLAEKLLTYALGRGLSYDDRCFVDEITRKTSSDGDRFSSLVLAIVESPPFQERSKAKGDR